jgi:hypothetical protein
LTAKKEKQVMATCPACKGTGNLAAIATRKDANGPTRGQLELPCVLCEGRREIPNVQLEWVRYGALLCNYRMDRLRLGLREAADMLGMKASALSAIELGRVDNTGWVYPSEMENK